MKKINKLISLSSGHLGCGSREFPESLVKLADSCLDEFARLYWLRNGFYAFEGALHVFPLQSSRDEIGLCEWNSHVLWRYCYEESTDGCLFFAEDIFGMQFCVAPGGVHVFDPETGAREFVSDSLEGWAQAILEDCEALTGYPLAHQWQLMHGPVPVGKRLLPKLPFVLGGEFDIQNLRLCDSLEGMRFRAEIARQIRNLPDGSEIEFLLSE